MWQSAIFFIPSKHELESCINKRNTIKVKMYVCNTIYLWAIREKNKSSINKNNILYFSDNNRNNILLHVINN